MKTLLKPFNNFSFPWGRGIALSLLFIWMGCDDELAIEPEQSLSDDVVFSSYTNARGVLLGAYNLMQDVSVFGSIPQTLSDATTDNVNFSGELPNMQAFNNFSVTKFNSIPDDNWKDTYQVIEATNRIIAFASQIPDASQTDIDQLIAEARFIRGICYFLLANLYAQPYHVENGANPAVPLYLSPFDGVDFQLSSRNTLAEVYNQVEADLNAATSGLPPASAASQQGFAYSGAAQAMLCRLHLYKRDWNAAIGAARAVINSGAYALHPDLSFYSTNSSEIIFSLEFTPTSSGTADGDVEESFAGWDAYYNGRDGGGRGDAEFSTDLATLFTLDPLDNRGRLKEAGTDFGGSLSEYTLKYNSPQGASDFHMIRYAEILLNLAEALVQVNGLNQEAIDWINPIRLRAGTTPWKISDFNSSEALLEALYNERRKELCFEGHRRMDLLRTGKPLRSSTTIIPDEVTVSNAGVGVSAGNPLAIWPIPQSQIDQNELLTQNPGY